MKLVVWLHHKTTTHFCAQPHHVARLWRAFPELEVVHCQRSSEVEPHLPEAVAAIVWSIHQNQVDAAPKLKVLATPAAGRDYFQVELPESVQRYHGSFHGRLMAETAVGYLLSASRGIVQSALLQQQEQWPRDQVNAKMRLLRGSHLGILGFGRIGQSIGELAKLHGVRVTGIKQTVIPKPSWMTEGDAVCTVDELDSLLPELDHLLLCLPRSGDTDQILDAQRIALLPSHAWVHNLGRGNAIDESALADVLQSGTLAGACLDVFEEEPLAMDSPLRSCPTCLVMPHASAIAPEYVDYFLDEFIPWLRTLLS